MPFQYKGEPLVGKSNYIEWKTKADLYLEINGYMPYIKGTKVEPNKALYFKKEGGTLSDEPYSPETAIKYSERLAEFEDNQNKALGALKSIISIENIERFKAEKTAKSLYQQIVDTFGKTSFEQIGYYLDKLNYTRYSEANSMDSYTSTIQSSYYSLKELGQSPSKASMAWNLLKGLPSTYDAFISRKYEDISEAISDNDDIDLNKLVAELISEESRIQSFVNEDKAYVTKSKSKSKNKTKHCKFCSKQGHLETECYRKHPELMPNRNTPKKAKDEDDNKDRSSLLLSKGESTKDLSFIIDSGATEHWTPYKEWLQGYKTEKKTIYLANDTKIEAYGYGDIDITVYNERTRHNIPITINRVYYSPEISYNLLSIKRIIEKGWNIIAKKDKMVISNSTITLFANWYNNLCQLRFNIPRLLLSNSEESKTTTTQLVHERLGHISSDYINSTLTNTKGFLLEKNPNLLKDCESCLQAKITKNKGQKSISNSSRPLELIHTDISGPYPISYNGKRYVISFIDDYTRSTWVYPITAKSEAIDTLKELYNKLYTNLELKIARIRADNAKEYQSTKWTEFTKEKGIINEYSAPYSPEQNGIAERYNRTIIEHARAAIIAKDIPIKLWPYIIEATCYILNRVYNKAINKTPYEALLGSKPDISNIRILGSLVYRLLPKPERESKLSLRGEQGILIGFKSINYQVYIPKIDKVKIVRDISILEDQKYSQNRVIESPKPLLDVEGNEEEDNTAISSKISDLSIEIPKIDLNRDEYEEYHSSTSKESETEEEKQEDMNLRRSRRSRQPPIRYRDQASLASTAYISMNEDIEEINEFKEPQSYEEAINSHEKDLWLKAMEKELQTLNTNNTWSIVDLPANNKPISTRWVYKIKKNDDKSLSYKARLVARGFEQIYGLNYLTKYAGVIKQQTFKAIFAIATIKGYIVRKIDMISAFTQGDLLDTIYLKQPEGFIDPNYPEKVLLLNKALYGLVQSANIWFNLLSKEIKSLGFKQLQADNCVYYNDEKDTIIITYVDDIAITGPDNDYISEIIAKLSNKFAITDLGPITNYLGIEIQRSPDYKTTTLSQKDYLIKILKRFNMDKSNPVSTPMDFSFIRQKYDKTASIEDIKWYQQAIGSLLYAALLTRPDIAYATNTLGRYASNPGPEHIKAIKRVFRYLKGSLDYNITYRGDAKTSSYITGYTDADYAGEKDEYKSTTGYIFYLANGPISYKSKLQPITAQSTTEAEYIALANTAKEATYIKALITELGLYKQSNIPLYSDNNGAIQLAKNPAYHERSKHINVRYHLIRQKLADDTISIHYIPTKDQKADGLTKPLTTRRFKEFINLL